MASGDVLIKDTVTAIAPGVTEHEVVTNTSSMNDQKIDYLCEAEVGTTDSLKIVAGYGSDWSADSWGLVKTTDQAAGYEAKHPGETVVAAINADFFNMATGQPIGALVMGGEVKHDANGANYFAVLKDGTAVIRDSSVPLDDCETAVGGGTILIKDGQVQTDVIANDTYGAMDYSRTALGIKADGTVVTFVTYGRLYPVSCGRTYSEIAQMLYNSGCVSAIALDGGGSATYAARPEGSSALAVRNSPSDGAEREVSSTLLIVSTAKASGEFDHASLSPNNEVYTPGSTVAFSAQGVDSTGGEADLPSDVTWALASESASLGSIDATTGMFTAGADATGTVTVQLKEGDDVVGTTSIEIAKPDTITFSYDEVSLGFEEESDLGLIVRSEGRDVNYKDGDIVWTMTDVKDSDGNASTASLGTFSGNTFTSNADNSLNGYITATSKFDSEVKGNIHVIVGMLPTLVWDFEDYEVTDDEGNVTSTIAAQDYYIDGYTTENADGSTTQTAGILTHSNYGRGGSESIEIADASDDEPVRFGSHSLKLNFDFINCGAVTEGACVGTTESMTIPGTPTGIGVWVYAPEGVGVTYEGSGTQAGFWLRGYVNDGAGNQMPYDFTLEPKAVLDSEGNWNGVQPGVSWQGWVYCEADLTSLSGPFSIQPGMTFRLMYVAGTKMGTNTAGSIYFDNLQFVYGTNIDDTDNPVVNLIKAENAELNDGDVIETNTITFNGFATDVENKYTSGIDDDTVRMYLDGVDVSEDDSFTYNIYNAAYSTAAALSEAHLQNGEHAIKMTVRDKAGNESSLTRTFTVAGDGLDGVPTLGIDTSDTSAVLGGSVALQLVLSDDSQVSDLAASIKLNNQFKNYTVEFADGWTGTQAYKELTGTISIECARTDDVDTQDGLVATITVPVPSTLTDSATFTYELRAGGYSVDGKTYTSSQAERTLPISTAYSVSAEPIVVGFDGTIVVTDASGSPAQGVEVIYVGDAEESLGTTDENGELVTSRFSGAAGDYVVYAQKDGKLSYRYTVSAYDAQGDENGAPYGIMLNVSAGPSTTQSISWLSSPKANTEQCVQYKAAGSDEWVTAQASESTLTFTQNGDEKANVAALSHSALIEGLAPGTQYAYRVGCDAVWSSEGTFTTDAAQDSASFFVLGDIQAEDLTNINALVSQIKDKDFDFGIQTGDAVDDATSYSDWTETLGLLGESTFSGTDMLHVLGNHEFAGDADASRAASVYNLPTKGYGSCYSVTYGNVYVATINYTGTADQLESALEWLKADAAASDARWKVLCMHQPAYYTNTVGGNAEIHALVPSVVDEAGIDFVFSGHDHSYARTEPLTGGEVEEKDGAVYFICGSSGEKSYTVTDNADFHFAKLSSDYTGIYLAVETTDEYATVNVYETDGSLLDTYTKKYYDYCEENGHTPTHYTDGLRCAVCGEALSDYTGWAVDAASGSQMYYVSGNYVTGWFTMGTEMQHFGSDGLLHNSTYSEVATTCLTQGVGTYTCECSAVKQIALTKPAGHEYEQQADGSYVCSVCGWERIELSDCTITLPYTAVSYTGAERRLYPTVVAPDGTQLEGGSVDFYVNWRNNVNVGTATVVITAKSGFNVNLTEFRGNYGGSVEVTFKIHPTQVTGLMAEAADCNTVNLSWTGSDGTETYEVYRSSDGGAKWTKVGETNSTSYEVAGLYPQTAYQFKVRAYTTVNGEVLKSFNYSDAVSITTPEAPAGTSWTVQLSQYDYTYSGAAHKPGVTVVDNWLSVVDSSNYTVSYENNKNAGTATAHVSLTTDSGVVELTRDFTINKATIAYCTADLSQYEYTYDGAAKAPAVTVRTARGTALVKGKNYDVEYLDNVNAGTATVRITGINNYSGVLTAEFAIAQASQSAPAVGEGYTVDGEAKTASAVEGYEISADGNVWIAAGEGEAVDLAGVESILVRKAATENYLVSDATANAVPANLGATEGDKFIASVKFNDDWRFRYTGGAITPEFTVYYNGVELARDVDYTWDGKYYADLACTQEVSPTERGWYYVKVVGAGDYMGVRKGSFQIRRASIFAATADKLASKFYDGQGYTPVPALTNVSGLEQLAEGRDFTVEYYVYTDVSTGATAKVDGKPTEAGNYLAVCTGEGNYIGTKKVWFQIRRASIFQATAERPASHPCDGKAYTPVPVLTSSFGETLVAGVDFEVEGYYTSEKCTAATKVDAPTDKGAYWVKLTGIGDYQGAKKVYFTIS